MTIGDRIKTVRMEKGLSITQLAKKMGVAEGTIRQYETGRRNPKPKTIEKFASALNVSVDYLCVDPDEYKKWLEEIEQKTLLSHEAIQFFKLNHHFSLENIIKLGMLEEKLDIQQKRWIESMIEMYFILNEKGQQVALERIRELTKIPEYQKEEGM